MPLLDFLREINEQVKIVTSSDFTIEITETSYVPRYDDPNITFGNLDTKIKKCKLLESCVLYVDMRDSAQISAGRMPRTLAKVYSSFVNSMIASARFYGGHIRNIIGDRVMVVFDKEKCFTKAVETGILMNTVAHHLINKHIKDFEFKCGIGIDYGKMLITKTGVYRKGEEKDFYRSLVWLGKPANIASRLTDIANKNVRLPDKDVRLAFIKEYGFDNWEWKYSSYKNFLEKLSKKAFSRELEHSDPEYISFYLTNGIENTSNYSPILMTDSVYNGYKDENPNDEGITNNWWKLQPKIPDYEGNIYGGDVYKKVIEDL